MPDVLVLLGKPDCHLCHEMRQIVEKVLAAFEARLEERNLVESDRETRVRYGHDIPVLFVGGQEVARHRIAEDELHARLLGLGLRPRST